MAEVMKRLEEIERDLAAGRQPPHHTTFLLRLTRALLESQGELFETLESEHESEFMGTHGCTLNRPGRPCATCALLDRAEKVRKGEV